MSAQRARLRPDQIGNASKANSRYAHKAIGLHRERHHLQAPTTRTLRSHLVQPEEEWAPTRVEAASACERAERVDPDDDDEPPDDRVGLGEAIYASPIGEQELRFGRPADVRYPARPLEQANERGRRVELCRSAPWRADAGARGGSCATPRRTRDPERREVPALVLLRRGLPAEHVADRVTLHVTWCNSTMRARPAHNSAVRAPPIAPDSVHRGRTAPRARRREEREQPADHPRVGVFEQFGAYRAAEVTSPLNSQPTCACAKLRN